MFVDHGDPTDSNKAKYCWIDRPSKKKAGVANVNIINGQQPLRNVFRNEQQRQEHLYLQDI